MFPKQNLSNEHMKVHHKQKLSVEREYTKSITIRWSCLKEQIEPLSSLVAKCRQLLQMASLCSAAAFAFVWLVPACRLAIDMMILGTNFWPLVVVSSWRSRAGSLAAFIHAVAIAVCMFCSRNWQQQLTIAPKWPCFDACGLLQLVLLLPLLLLLLLLGCHYPAAHEAKKNCRVAAAFWPTSVGHLRR